MEPGSSGLGQASAEISAGRAGGEGAIKKQRINPMHELSPKEKYVRAAQDLEVLKMPCAPPSVSAVRVSDQTRVVEH